MKRSIRAAAVLCAVAVALSVLLAGCGNDEEEGNGSGGLGGYVGTNPFKGLTIVHEAGVDKDDPAETYAFTSDTKGTYSNEYYSEDFEYAVDSTKGLLKVRRTVYTIVSGGEEMTDATGTTVTTEPTVKTITLDDYIAENFGNLDKETKSLIYDAMANAYWHYKFSADGKTVEMDSSYYFGNMAESGARFYYEDGAGNGFYFERQMWFDIRRDDGWYEYEGFPKFSGNTFTAVIFAVDYDRETDTENHRKLSAALIGTYQISGTGTNCTGTVTFMQLPDEFKGAFEVNKPYTIMQRDYGYKTYTVKN